MNWDAIGAVAELAGALGVIASLVYLGRQIHQNTESVRMASHHEVANHFQQTNLVALQDPVIAELLRRALQDSQTLSEAERHRFGLFLMALFRTYEELFRLNEKGLVEPDLWDYREKSMMHWLSHDIVRSWWQNEQRVSFIAPFATRVELRLSELAVDPAADQARG